MIALDLFCGAGGASTGDFFTVAGHWVGTTEEWSSAMDIFWMTKTELAQAIPPAYSEYLVRQILEKM